MAVSYARDALAEFGRESNAGTVIRGVERSVPFISLYMCSIIPLISRGILCR